MLLKTDTFYPSTAALRSQIEAYRLIEIDQRLEGDTVANGRIDAVIILRGKISIYNTETTTYEQLADCVFFPFTRRGTFRVSAAKGTQVISIKFYPHVLAASCFDGLNFHTPLAFSEAFDYNIAIQRLRKVASAWDLESIKIELDAFFEREILGTKANAELMDKVFSLVERESQDVKSLGMLAEDLGVSTKTIERHFKNYTGLTVKMYQDLVRFQKTAREIKAKGKYHHGDLMEALGNGYYDQSHFVKASRNLTGLAPRELFSRMPAELTDFIVF